MSEVEIGLIIGVATPILYLLICFALIALNSNPNGLIHPYIAMEKELEEENKES